MFPRWMSVPALCVAATCLSGGSPARAEEQIKLTLGTVTLLDVASDIQTVVVAAPDVADATVTAPRKLFLLGRKTGRTSLLVFGANGVPLREATVIVAASDAGTVTLNRGTKESTLSCTPRCSEADISKSGADSGSPSSPPAPPAPAGPSGGAAPAAAAPVSTGH